MAWALGFILILSAAFLASFPLLERKGRPWGDAGRRVTGLYVLLVAITLMEMIYSFTGKQDEQIRQLATRFEYTGVNVTVPELGGPRGFARLTGSIIDADAPEKRGFRWFALPSDAVIDVRPMVKGDAITGYRIDATGMSKVVRLNGVCVNRVVGGWTPVGSKMQVEIRPGSSTPAITFSLNVKDGEVEVESPQDKSGLEPAPLRINQTLGDLLGAAKASGLQAALKDIHDEEGRTLLDAFVVRRTRGEGDSALALVWSANPDAFTINVSSPKFEGNKDIPSNEGAFHLAVDDDTLVLPSQVTKLDGGAAGLAFRFRPARAYAMPPLEILKGNKRNLDFASVNIAPTGHGYLFDTGNLNFPILRRGTLAEDGNSLTIGGADVLKANKEVPLGAGPVAPLFCLRDPISDVGGAWMAPCAGILIGALLAILGLVGFGSRLDPVEDVDRSFPAFVVWAGVVALLAVRAVLSFRVSMLPPFNMSATASDAYHNAWPTARWLLLWAPPALGLLTAIVARVLGRGIPYAIRKKWKKRGEALSESNRGPILGKIANVLLVASIVVSLGVVFSNLTGFHLVRSSALLTGILLFSTGFLCLSFVNDVPEETNGDGPDLSIKTLLGKYRSPAALVGGLTLLSIFLSTKLTLLVLLAALGALCYVERPLFPLLWRRFKILIAGLCMLAADPGSSLYAVPFLIAMAVASSLGSALAQKSTRSATWNWASLVPVVIAAGLLITPFIGGPLSGIGTTMVKRGMAGETGYRLVAANLDHAHEVLASPDMAGSKLDPQHLLGAMHQRWQMDEYVRGAGTGYFKSPLSGIGMTYPTLLADASFSSLLVAEHGDLGAWFGVGLHLIIALALFMAAWMAAQSRRQKNTVRALYAFAGMFGFVGLYMALANLWVLPFTGQNVPLLSLASGNDWVLYIGLSFLAIFLLAFPEGGRNRPDPAAEQRIRSIAWSWWSFPAGLTLAWCLLLVLLLRGKGDPTVPFSYPDRTYEALQRTLGDAEAEQAKSEVANPSLARTVAFRSTAPMFQRFAAQYDAGSVTRTPITLEPGRTHGLSLDRNRLRLTSPFVKDQGVPWHGNLIAQYGIKRHQLLIAGGRERFTLTPTGGSKHLRLGQPFNETSGRRIDFETQERVPGRGTVIDNYGGVELTDDGKIVVQWNDTLKPAVVRVNGARIDENKHRYELKPFDVVSLELRDDTSRGEGFSLCYLGPNDDKLAQVIWRNGRYMRVFPQASDFPLAYAIGQVGDSAARKGKVPTDVSLTLNLALQRDLQKVLRGWGRQRQRAVDRGGVSNEGLPFTAVCVLDSFSGQVRGLASIPQVDPNDDIETIKNGFDREHDAYVAAHSSWAFVNRMVGSTIKPLSFSALATQLNRDGFDLSKISISEQAGIGTSDDGQTRYCQLGDTHLSRGLTMEQNPRASVSMFDFLKDSRTWPAIVMTSMGLRHGAGSPMAMLSGSGRDVEYAGTWHKLGFHAATANDLFTSKLHLSSQALSETALFKGLEECYSPTVQSFTAKRGTLTDDFATGLLPFDLKNVTSSEVRANALPEPHWADQTLLTDFDGQMVRYMIGSGECRWNALTMSANMARITTGYQVRPTFSTEAVATPAEMPTPLNNQTWREAHLLAPLGEISTLSGAPGMYEAARAAGFRLVMKTGTIDDGVRGPSSKESEMLMFTVGEYGAKGFVKGRTISGYISIRASKSEGGEMVKSELVSRVLPVLIAHLKETKAVASKVSGR